MPVESIILPQRLFHPDFYKIQTIDFPTAIMDENLVLIQQGDSTTTLPLVLIHDGGGTIWHYHSLGNLGRTVYGIDTQDTAKKDIPTTAEDYCEMARELPQLKKIILGGWSLGGYIALEMAKVFENDPDVHVAGIVLIESIYPKLIRTHYPRVDRLDLAYDKDFRNDVRDRIFRNLDQSIQAAQSYIVDPQQEMPPTVLIRADSVMPSLEGVEYPDMLGWDEDGHDFVKHVYNVPGHHFSIFLQENAPKLTVNLSEACTMLENGVWS